jgi:hypothetical protein
MNPPQTPGVHLAIFADDTCVYATDRKEDFIVRKFQRGLSSMEALCERWNIKINEDKTQEIYFCHSCRPPASRLTLNGRIIPFVNDIYVIRKLHGVYTYKWSKPRPLEHLLEYTSYSKVCE